LTARYVAPRADRRHAGDIGDALLCSNHGKMSPKAPKAQR
jgi:hypothetical protein